MWGSPKCVEAKRICLYFCSLSPFPCYLSLLLFVMICNLGLQPSFPGIRGINE